MNAFMVYNVLYSSNILRIQSHNIMEIRLASTISIAVVVLSRFTSAFVLQSCPSITCRSTEVFGTPDKVDKGFNLLGQRFVPQGPIVATVKGGWNLIWRRMMAELAPQDRGGKYQRPAYALQGSVEPEQDLHVYLGEACPWCHRYVRDP